jgi:hypothetical protein
MKGMYSTGWFKALVEKQMGLLEKLHIFFIFAITSELRRFYVGVAFIIVIVDFHKGETFRFT